MITDQRKIMNNKQILGRLFILAIPYYKLIILAVILMIIFAVVNAVPALYIKNIIDALESGKQYQISRFVFISLAIIMIYTIKAIIGFWQQRLLGNIGVKITADMRYIVYKKIIYLPLSFFDETKTAHIYNRIAGDLNQIQNFVLTVLRSYLLQIPQIIVLIGIMFYRSWILSLLIFIIFPFIGFIVKFFNTKLKRVIEKEKIQNDSLSSIILEVLRAIKIVKSFSTEKLELKKFNKTNQSLLVTAKKTIKISASIVPSVELLNSIFLAFVFITGGFLINQSIISTGDIASFLVAASLAYIPIKTLSGITVVIQTSLISARRIFEILDIANPIIEHDNKKIPLKEFHDKIEIHIKSFSYNKKQKILRNIRLTIPKGQFIAFVGKTGSGKSTIANLLPRFYDIEKDKGSIKIDGKDIRDLQIASLRKQIAIVSQDSILFDDSIENNITYGKQNYTKKELQTIAKQSHVDEFVDNSSKKYNTLVGERGVKLSGGQKQRINLARAFMKQAPILIFDEPTSALDSESEAKIFSFIKPLIKKSTAIIIAHRLSTIKNADIIYVLHNGTIIEQGTHKALLAKKKRYYNLYKLQES